MIHVKDGQIFINGHVSTDPEIIGTEMMEAAQREFDSRSSVGSLLRFEALVKTECELQNLQKHIEQNEDVLKFVCEFNNPVFSMQWPSSQLLVNLIGMIKSGSLATVKK